MDEKKKVEKKKPKCSLEYQGHGWKKKVEKKKKNLSVAWSTRGTLSQVRVPGALSSKLEYQGHFLPS